MEKNILVAKAYARHLRVSARKVRLVIDLIRGAKVSRALAILAHLNKQAKIPVGKALQSAVHNALINPGLKREELFISKITADSGPMLKRYRAAAMGRATMIRHRTTHLSIELSRKQLLQQKTVQPKKAANLKPLKLKKAKAH